MRMSRLVRRTLVAVIILFGAVVIVTSGVAGWNLNELLLQQYQSKGTAIANSVASSSVEILLNRDASTLQSVIDQYTEIQGVSYVFIMDDQGEIVAHTFVPTIPREVYYLGANKSGTTVRDISIPVVGSVSDVSAPILAGEAGYVHVGMNKGAVTAQITSAIEHIVIVIFVVMVLLVSGLALWLTRRITGPVLALTESARSIERGERFVRGPLERLTGTGDELADLARVFSQMATTLEQRAEEERKAAEARHRSLFDSVPVGLYWTAQEGQFLDANQALVEILGYPDKQSLLATAAFEVYANPEDRLRWRSQLEATGVLRGFEFQIRRRDGTLIWANNSARVVCDDAGRALYYDGVIEDITERKLAQDRLKEAREAADRANQELESSFSRLRRSYDDQNALNALLALSIEDTPLDELLDHALQLVLSLSWLSLESKGAIFLAQDNSDVLVMSAQKDLSDPIKEACAQIRVGWCLCGRAAASREVEFASDLDDRHDVTYEGIPPHGHYCVPLVAGGRLLGVMTLYVEQGRRRDDSEMGYLRAVADVLAGIIERGRASAELREAHNQLVAQYHAAERARSEARATLDAASDGMVLISPDGLVLSVNSRFNELFMDGEGPAAAGRRIEELVQGLEDLFADASGFRSLMTESLRDRERQFVQMLSQQRPRAREFQVYSTPVLDNDGQTIGRLYAFRDVTREREVDRMKSEFVSLVSHELRTPLTSIKGYVDLLLEGEVGEVPDDQREFLGIVKSNADRLVALINDLLDISRIESGRVELKLAPLDVERTVRAVVKAMKPQIESKKQTLTVVLPPNLPALSADVDRVTQILTNLVSNAYKYTPAGGTITVSAERRGEWVSIGVKDTGIGLSPEEQEQLFTKFFRAKNRVTQEVGGTGLGLPITKTLVEMHGGQMTVTSATGKGSTFSFTLPVVPSTQAAPELPVIEDLPVPARPGGLVLVVDDEPEIAYLMRRYLERGGYRVLVAANGKEALQMAKAELPDLITLDVKLPDVDGFTVLEWLKNEPETQGIPVLMLSMVEDQGQSKLLGAVDYIVKPTQEDALLERVGRALAKGQPKTILVAEDDANVRRLLAGYLRRAGYEVLEAENGDEAVQLATAELPGLILLDVMMPVKDGITALRELRSRNETRNLPVLIMTASPSVLEESRSDLERLGVSGLLSKPFSAEELAATIARGLASAE